MIERWDRLEAVGATAVAVVFDPPEALAQGILDGVEPPFPVLSDPDRVAYADWELRRLPWWRIYLDPRVIWAYLRFLLSGERFRPTGRDPLQLGGDFVVGADGTLVYVRPQTADNRPPVGELIRAAEEAAPR